MEKFKGHSAPWVFDMDNDEDEIVVYSDNGIQPYVCYSVKYPNEKETANMALIAAAPDLLEVCLAVMAAETRKEIEAARKMCGLAINKALNQQ